jgi:predicted Zn-dependent peptidase
MARALCFVLLALVLSGCAAWRERPPETAQRVRFRIPEYQEHPLPNGLTLYFHRDDYLPMVSIQLALRGGDAALPPDKAGLMTLVYKLLLSENRELRQGLDALGGRLLVDIAPHGTRAEVTVESAQAYEALRLLAPALRTPPQDMAMFERVRAQLLTEIFEEKPSPVQLAADTLRASLYGDRHALGVRGHKRIQTVSRLQLPDVAAAYTSTIGPGNTAVVLVGRIAEIPARAWVHKSLGDWSAPVAAPQIARPEPLGPRKEILVVPWRGLATTQIAIGGLAAPLGDPSHHPARIASELLGCYIPHSIWESAASEAVISTSVESVPGTASFVVTAPVAVEETARSLARINDQLSAQLSSFIHFYFRGSSAAPVRITIKQREVLSSQLRRAALSRLVYSFSGLPAAGERAAELFLHGLPLYHYRQPLPVLDTLDDGDVERALIRYFRADTVRIVLVGDPDRIRAQLAPLGLGSVQIVQAD